MRTYRILAAKAELMRADAEIQGLLAEIRREDPAVMPLLGTYTKERAAALRAHAFDTQALAARGLQYERLDQLVTELLLGVR
ncbi:MAG: xylose isomerase, partial [Planctomycetota bacterium]